MTSLSHFIFTLVVVVVASIWTSVEVEANNNNQEALIWVQDSGHCDKYCLFSQQFAGVKLNDAGLAWVTFQAGDYADFEYVLSFDWGAQSPSFYENWDKVIFDRPGTWWIYMSPENQHMNYDYIQIRVVANTFTGDITPLQPQPPQQWRYGWPPYPVLGMTQGGTDAGAGDDASAYHPLVISSPSPRSSTSIAVWLAPLLVGIIIIAIAVPIVIVAYKKGKKNAKQMENQAAIANQAQDANRVQVASV